MPAKRGEGSAQQELNAGQEEPSLEDRSATVQIGLNTGERRRPTWMATAAWGAPSRWAYVIGWACAEDPAISISPYAGSMVKLVTPSTGRVPGPLGAMGRWVQPVQGDQQP